MVDEKKIEMYDRFGCKDCPVESCYKTYGSLCNNNEVALRLINAEYDRELRRE